MREIKFRAWNAEEKIMGPSFTIGQFCGVYPMSDNIDTEGIEYFQFTGLKDKNGKEIYEGDIIKWAFVNTGEFPDDETFYEEVVEWNECGFFLEGGAPLTVAMDDCEVIGNIYENPELL